jgi:hypothetical protein
LSAQERRTSWIDATPTPNFSARGAHVSWRGKNNLISTSHIE